jgi:hypothetical protein
MMNLSRCLKVTNKSLPSAPTVGVLIPGKIFVGVRACDHKPIGPQGMQDRFMPQMMIR